MSEIFGQEVYLIRADDSLVTLSKDKTRKYTKVSPDDQRKAFCCGAPIHVVNQNSIEALKKVQREKYENDSDVENLVNAEVAIFRPSFVIDE